MAEPKESSFDRVAYQFLEGYSKQVNGYIRYEIIRVNLLTTITALKPNGSSGPKRIIDVGAGDGTDARWLAGLGHEVVAADPSSTMIERAKAYKTPDLAEILHGDASSALQKYGQESFDGVLSHGVLPYMEDPQKHLEELARLVHIGGFISLLSKGFSGTLLRYANERKFTDMRDYIKTGRYVVNRLGEDATAYAPEQTERFLSKAGFNLIDWFGVTIITDGVEEKADEFDKSDLELLLEQELTLSRNSSTRGMGQMLHFIAQKNTC